MRERDLLQLCPLTAIEDAVPEVGYGVVTLGIGVVGLGHLGEDDIPTSVTPPVASYTGDPRRRDGSRHQAQGAIPPEKSPHYGVVLSPDDLPSGTPLEDVVRRAEEEHSSLRSGEGRRP